MKHLKTFETFKSFENNFLLEGLKSKKELFTSLEEFSPEFFSGVTLKHDKIGNETYGKSSCIYVKWQDAEMKQKGENFLTKLGFKIYPYDVKNTSEINVSYFKGSNYNESVRNM